jgi:hypothetical protein
MPLPITQHNTSNEKKKCFAYFFSRRVQPRPPPEPAGRCCPRGPCRRPSPRDRTSHAARACANSLPTAARVTLSELHAGPAQLRRGCACSASSPTVPVLLRPAARNSPRASQATARTSLAALAGPDAGCAPASSHCVWPVLVLAPRVHASGHFGPSFPCSPPHALLPGPW